MIQPVKLPFTASAYLKTTTNANSLARTWIENGLPKWVTLVDEALFLLASIMFVVGSFSFFPGVPEKTYVEGCELFVVGSAMYVGLAVFTSYEILEDARLSRTEPDAIMLLEQALYIIGSILFLAGTIDFMPPDLSKGFPLFATLTKGPTSFWARFFSPPDALLLLGDELFVIGSILFAIAAFVAALKAAGETASDAASALARRTAVASASIYELGSVAYCIGTLGFIPKGPLGIAACPAGGRAMEVGGAILFVVGSLLYSLGSFLTLSVVGYLTYSDETLLPRENSVAAQRMDVDMASGQLGARIGAPLGVKPGQRHENVTSNSSATSSVPGDEDTGGKERSDFLAAARHRLELARMKERELQGQAEIARQEREREELAYSTSLKARKTL